MYKSFRINTIRILNLFRTANYFSLFIIFIFVSCEQLYNVANDTVIARAGNSYLYYSELNDNITIFSSQNDSVLQAENYIDRWARKQLFFDQAIINLDLDTQQDLDELVNTYRSDLWSRTYKESIVKSSIDTLISKEEIQKYYLENQNNFKLNDVLMSYRFIALPEQNIDILEIKEKLIRFKEDDMRFLDSLSFQFNSFELRDSLWFSKREVIRSLPIINEENFDEYLKKSQFFLVEDAFEVYLLFVNDYMLRNELAPLVSIENTIRKIVFNKRKLNFIRQFDKEILQDAIRTNKFQIYR